MLDLNNRDWAPFKISDLFQPARGTEKNMTSLQIGDVPLISARNCDNGVKAFVSIPNERLHRGHAITLNNDGDGGGGSRILPTNGVRSRHPRNGLKAKRLKRKPLKICHAIRGRIHF